MKPRDASPVMGSCECPSVEGLVPRHGRVVVLGGMDFTGAWPENNAYISLLYTHINNIKNEASTRGFILTGIFNNPSSARGVGTLPPWDDLLF